MYDILCSSWPPNTAPPALSWFPVWRQYTFFAQELLAFAIAARGIGKGLKTKQLKALACFRNLSRPVDLEHLLCEDMFISERHNTTFYWPTVATMVAAMESEQDKLEKFVRMWHPWT